MFMQKTSFSGNNCLLQQLLHYYLLFDFFFSHILPFSWYFDYYCFFLVQLILVSILGLMCVIFVFFILVFSVFIALFCYIKREQFD